MKTMTRYRFSIGDSNTTGVGICFGIVAEDAAAAMIKAQSFVAEAGYGLAVGCEGADDVMVYAGPDLKVIIMHLVSEETEAEAF